MFLLNNKEYRNEKKDDEKRKLNPEGKSWEERLQVQV